MSDKTPGRELYDAALAEALAPAPLPHYDPIQAGLLGAVIATAVVYVFCIIAGLRTDVFDLQIGIMTVLGFVAPYGTLKLRERKYYRVFTEVYTRMRAEADAANGKG